MAMPQFEDGQVLFASDLNALVDDADSGVITSPSGIFTPASGWTVEYFVARRAHGIAVISARLTGGSISGSGATTVGTVTSAWRPPSGTYAYGMAYYASTGFLLGTAEIQPSGAVRGWKENTAARGEIRFTIPIPLAN